MTKIEYNGSVVATVEGGNTATLPIKDKKMKSDIKITVPEAEAVEEYDGAIVIEEGESLISFTIDGTSYEAEDGMTWAEWCESDYNTGGFGSYGPWNTSISTSSNPDYYIYFSGVYLSFDNIIIEGASYITKYRSYGSGGAG